MGPITHLLYLVSTSLMIPVIVLLIAGFAWALLLLGGLYGGLMARRRMAPVLSQVETDLAAGATLDPDNASLAAHHPALHQTLTRVHAHAGNPIHADKVLADFDLDADRQLNPAKLLMRLGPMLGLMGTLIPMGPALTGLASGDIVSMAANMQVAFATTVVGVFVGGVGYLVLLIRKRWCTADVNTLQYLIELAGHDTH